MPPAAPSRKQSAKIRKCAPDSSDAALAGDGIAALVAMALLSAGVSVPGIFLFTALANLVLLAVLCRVQPAYLRAARGWLAERFGGRRLVE